MNKTKRGFLGRKKFIAYFQTSRHQDLLTIANLVCSRIRTARGFLTCRISHLDGRQEPKRHLAMMVLEVSLLICFSLAIAFLISGEVGVGSAQVQHIQKEVCPENWT